MANNLMHSESENPIAIISDASNLGESIGTTLRKIGVYTQVLNLEQVELKDNSFDRVGAIIVPINSKAHHRLIQNIVLTALHKNLASLFLGSGFQILNAILGGGEPTSTPDHSSSKDGKQIGSLYHRIFIAPGSKLAAIVGSGGFVRVNSRHEHGLKESQRSRLLIASGYSLDDGVIEALESPNHQWVIATQFNPEIRGELPPHFDRLFQSLSDRAAEATNYINLNMLISKPYVST